MKQLTGATMAALAALAGVLILVFGYVFGVSPQLSAAGIANDEHALAVQDNQSITDQIEKLKGLELEVPAWQADIDEVAEQTPSLPDTEHLHRMLIDAATEAGIPWVTFRVEDISLIDATAPAPAPAPAPTTGADATAEDSGTTGAAPVTPAAGAAGEGLVAVQFTVTSEGHPDAVKQFLTNMYQQTRRYVTLSGLSIDASRGADAAPGRPGLAKGDVTITLSGVAFVLIDPEHPLEIDEAGGVPVPVAPSPSPSASPSASPSPSPSPSPSVGA